MELQTLATFSLYARKNNFGKAARRCEVAQPSLTTAIKRLEESVGGLLFPKAAERATNGARTRHQTSPRANDSFSSASTPEGELIYTWSDAHGVVARHQPYLIVASAPADVTLDERDGHTSLLGAR